MKFDIQKDKNNMPLYENNVLDFILQTGCPYKRCLSMILVEDSNFKFIFDLELKMI